jgi:hypothetical protein
LPPEQILKLPTKPDDDKAWGEIFRQLGRPDKPEGYKIELPANATAEVKEVTAELAAVAHKAGLNQAQLKPLIDMLQGKATAAVEAALAARETETKTVQDTLKAEWGDKYSVYGGEIGKLIVELGGQDLLTELNDKGIGNSLGLSRFLAKLVDKVAQPGAAPGAGGQASGADRPLTPLQAKAERMQLEQAHGDALREKSHAQHAWALGERNRLLAFENPKAA